MSSVRQLKWRNEPGKTIRSLMGRTVSHYRIVAKLGSGGMAVVFRAKDVRLRRQVALKVASSDTLTKQELYDGMVREACAGSALNHPNVCAVYDMGEFQGLPFIVTELLEGQTLKEQIKKPSTLQRFLHLAIQISDGLDAVHSKGIVHSDIKPSNIFVTTADQVKIFDFGLATRANNGPMNQGHHCGDIVQRAGPGSVMGTPAYMSPEHFLGKPLDCRADLFSLGVVFYEMLTGARPFESNTPETDLSAARSLFPISARRDLPSSLAQLIEETLEHNREFRCQYAGEVRAGLKRIQRDFGIGGRRSQE
jgi:serine/threonine protein kinase